MGNVETGEVEEEDLRLREEEERLKGNEFTFSVSFAKKKNFSEPASSRLVTVNYQSWKKKKDLSDNNLIWTNI